MESWPGYVHAHIYDFLKSSTNLQYNPSLSSVAAGGSRVLELDLKDFSASIVNVKDICSIVPTAVWKWQNRFSKSAWMGQTYFVGKIVWLGNSKSKHRS